MVRRPNSAVQAMRNGHLCHVSWAQRPQDRQVARDARRSSSLTEPPPRCSRSALLTLLIAPAEPDPEGLPGAGRLQLGSETAARTCQRAACGLPAAAALRAAGALPAALSARGLLQRSYPCSNSVQSGSFRGCLGVLEVPRVALGGCRNVFCGQI